MDRSNRSLFVIAIAIAALGLGRNASTATTPAAPPPAATTPAPVATTRAPEAPVPIVHAAQDDDTAVSLEPYLTEGRDRVERFFGEKFTKPFTVEIFADRAAFDAYFSKRWNIPETQAWMVASGVADSLAILSPRVWATQAAEHDAANAGHVRDLIAHELVHVFHGQHNPRPDFDGMDDSGWFVEGLAVYVSGQLDGSHKTAALDALKAGKAPAHLADAWSGRYRYGVSGSMVAYVDKRYGRYTIKKLLAVVSNEEALKLLGTSETGFLEAWKASLTATP